MTTARPNGKKQTPITQKPGSPDWIWTFSPTFGLMYAAAMIPPCCAKFPTEWVEYSKTRECASTINKWY